MVSKPLIVACVAIALSAQPPKPAFDPRLSVHTILREDIFSGYAGHMDLLAKGEKNLAVLLVERPEAKAPLLAWNASIALTRAVYAREAARDAEFDQHYRKALELYAAAAKAGPADG